MDSEEQVCLVFSGEVLPGFQADEVKRRFGEAFKIEGARLAAMFSGERTVLKRSLSREDAVRYVQRLRKLGVRVIVEPLSVKAPAAVLAAPTAAVVAAPVVAIPAEEQIVCPTCGTRQSKRILCKECSTDMPRGIAAKKEDEDRARAERLEAARARRGLPPSSRVSSSAADADAPPLLGFGFEGRMARVPYLIAGVLCWMGLLVIAIGFAVWVPAARSVLPLLPLGLALLALVVWSTRVAVLRLHDFNFSGWWVVIGFVPYLGVVASLALLFVPGSREDNDYGGTPRQGNVLVAVLMVACIGVMGVLAWHSMVSRFERQLSGLPALAGNSGDDGDDDDSNDNASVAASAPPAEQQVSEHLRSAAAVASFRKEYWREPRHKAFAASEDGAWGWRSGQSSPRQAVTQALSACEQNRKPYTQPCQLVSVNGLWAGSR